MKAWRFEFRDGDSLIGWGASWHDALEDIPCSRWDGVVEVRPVCGRVAIGSGEVALPEGW